MTSKEYEKAKDDAYFENGDGCSNSGVEVVCEEYGKEQERKRIRQIVNAMWKAANKDKQWILMDMENLIYHIDNPSSGEVRF